MKNEKINLSNNLEINMIDKIDIDNDDDEPSYILTVIKIKKNFNSQTSANQRVSA